MRSMPVAVLCWSVSVAALSAQAVAIPVANASFEQPAIAAGTFATTSPPNGWSGYGALNFGSRTVGVLHPATTTLYAGPPPHGNQVGVVFLLDNPGNQLQFANSEAGLQQQLPTLLLPNRRYTLRVEVGNIQNDVLAPFLFAGFPGYRVELQAGGVPLVTQLGSVGPSEGGWLTVEVLVDIAQNHPQLGLPLRVRLGNPNAAPGIEVNFDDVRVSSEAIALWSDLGAGLAGTGGVPLLVGTGTLTAAAPNQFAITNAAVNAPGMLVAGLSSVFAPVFGGILVPAPEILFGLGTDATGAALLPFTLASSATTGTQLFAQYWVLDLGAPAGFAASNGMRATMP